MMTEITKPNVRSSAVLRLLTIHEALSLETLRALLNPEISTRRLRDVLGRLEKAHLVRRRRFNLDKGWTTFFEIAEPHRSNLGITPVHSALLTHNDSCALVASLLASEFPEARLIREFAIPRDEELASAMLYERKTPDSLPDILISLPTGQKNRNALIAVEIERSKKSAKRMRKKLRKYAFRTRLDGVVYVSEDPAVLTATAHHYQESTSSKSRRIGHYRDHFLITARCPTRQCLTFTDVSNSAGIPVSLTDWIRTLASISKDDRRDITFFESGAA